LQLKDHVIPSQFSHTSLSSSKTFTVIVSLSYESAFRFRFNGHPFLKINGLRIEFQIPSNCNWLPYSSSLSHQKFWLYFLEMQINGLGIEVVVKHCFGITDWKSLMCITTRYLFFIERNHGSLFFWNKPWVLVFFKHNK